MFKRVQPQRHVGVLDSTRSFNVDIPIERLWDLVADPAIPMPGVEDTVDGGWLPGHRLEVGAIQYSILSRDGRLRGEFVQVIACEPPHLLVQRQLQAEARPVTTFEWRLTPHRDGVTLTWTIRVDMQKPVSRGEAESVQAMLDSHHVRWADELSRDLGRR